jgi:Zn-dependent metalloprotease
VHAFSGVPNRAFALVAEALGGYSWERAGLIWWTTVSQHRVPSNCGFVEFADTTVDVAMDLFGDSVARIVRGAWDEVGIAKQTTS